MLPGVPGLPVSDETRSTSNLAISQVARQSQTLKCIWKTVFFTEIFRFGLLFIIRNKSLKEFVQQAFPVSAGPAKLAKGIENNE